MVEAMLFGSYRRNRRSSANEDKTSKSGTKPLKNALFENGSFLTECLRIFKSREMACTRYQTTILGHVEKY